MRFDETKRLLESEELRTIILRQEAGAGCLLLAPDLSARIMAVSMDGPEGENFGFVKPEAIAGRGRDPQFNAYGGALRWWVGPEGGQFGLAFPPGTKNFDLDFWYISEEYNGKPFAVAYPSEGVGTSALMGAESQIENVSGAKFHIGVTCRVSLLGDPLAEARQRGSKGKSEGHREQADHFGYVSETTFENLSPEPMKKDRGLVSIWMLAMYIAGPRTYVIAPFERQGDGKIVTDTYFSPEGITSDRLIVKERRGYLVFRADGKERSKIGLSRSRASNVMGSIDLVRNILTIWRFPVRRRMPYVNSLWEHQRYPYAGDVTNSYNDDGNFGNFYELECSSHALALGPRDRFCFPLEIHHYRGDSAAIFRIGEKLLGRRIDWENL